MMGHQGSLSGILWAGHIMRVKDHGYADEEETHGSFSGSGSWAVAHPA
jgi:hypothetical protein